MDSQPKTLPIFEEMPATDQNEDSQNQRRNPVVSENSVRFGNAEVMIFVEIMLASTMNAVFVACFALLTSTFQNRAELHAEILALRHQLAVLQRNAPRRLCLTRFDRLL